MGRLPKMPGTWGSLAALPLALLLHQTVLLPTYLLITTLIALSGVYATFRILRTQPGTRDPSFIVIDEVAGQLLAVAFIPPFFYNHLWLFYILGFVFFRLLDIFKPYPIGRVEHIRGWPALSVMADDIVAGLLASLTLLLLSVILL